MSAYFGIGIAEFNRDVPFQFVFKTYSLQSIFHLEIMLYI